MSLKDLREKLAMYLIEIQHYSFGKEHKNGPEPVVPDNFSRDEVPKPLCRRCFQEKDSISRACAPKSGRRLSNEQIKKRSSLNSKLQILKQFLE